MTTCKLSPESAANLGFTELYSESQFLATAGSCKKILKRKKLIADFGMCVWKRSTCAKNLNVVLHLEHCILSLAKVNIRIYLESCLSPTFTLF